MGKQEKTDGEKVNEVVTAVYKTNFHCLQCVREVQKPLMRTQGVEKVEVDMEKGEIKVKGKVDPKRIHEQIEKWSKKKVEIISPKIKLAVASEKGKEKQHKKEPILSTTMVKVHMHCTKCEYDLRRKLLKHKGVHSVNTDIKAQTLTVDGTIVSHKLVEYIRKKTHKQAEIMNIKHEKKEEKKDVVKEVDIKLVQTKKITEEGKEKKEADTKLVQTKKITEEGKEKKVELTIQEKSAPYFVHYVYAPQLFSDENPNACSIM